MIWRESLESLVEFLRADNVFDPACEVLNEALVQLVKDIGGDTGVDVGVREFLPERFEHAANAVSLELGIKGGPAPR